MLRFDSHCLRLSRPATLLKSLGRLVILQQAALLDDLLFLAEDHAHVVGIELAVKHQGLGEDVFRFLERQPPGGMQADARGRRHPDRSDLRGVLHVLDDPIQQSVEILDRRQAELDHRHVFGKLRRNL